jgi:hypothetical protein
MNYNIINYNKTTINEEQTMAKVSVEVARGTPCDLDGISQLVQGQGIRARIYEIRSWMVPALERSIVQHQRAKGVLPMPESREKN